MNILGVAFILGMFILVFAFVLGDMWQILSRSMNYLLFKVGATITIISVMLLVAGMLADYFFKITK